MATICPFAAWRPLPEAESQPAITPRTVIFHTAVGTLRGVERYFATGTGIESHFMVGGPWDGAELDGAIWQWMDLGRRADANLDANGFAISIETSDNAPDRPEDIAPWSPAQLASLVRLGLWLAERFAIPRRRCPAWDQAGFGWHAMWGAPSHWTPAVGKLCPGPARIRQLTEIVFPAIFAGTQLEEDDVSAADVITALRSAEGKTALRAAVWGGSGEEIPSIFGTTNAAQVVEVAARGVQSLANRLNEVHGRIGATEGTLLAALAALPTAGLQLTEEQLAAIANQVDLDPAAFVAAWRADLAGRPLLVTPG